MEYRETVDALKKDSRLRVWVAIFYPESTKPDWEKIWSDAFVKCSVSPVHDRDIWEEDGEDHKAGDFKKPHRHVVFQFSGSKSFNQVWDILKMIALDPNHCPPPKIPYGDISQAVQYHVHYNDKSKAQYLRSDIVSINGFDVDRYFRLNSEQEDQLFSALLDYITDNNIKEYWDLFQCLGISRFRGTIYDELYRYVRNHTILVNSLLKSRKYYTEEQYQQRKNKELKERFKDEKSDS